MADVGACDSCGRPLSREKWNSTTDVIVCDNTSCKLFRTPLKSEGLGTKEHKTAKKAKTKVPGWLKGDDNGTKGTGYAYRLQRLQRYLYTGDEETEIP